MTDNNHAQDRVVSIKLHIVWLTKNRSPILTGDVSLKTREIIRQMCERKSVEINQGVISKDHVRLFVSLPSKICVDNFVQQLKGKTSHVLMTNFENLRQQFWRQQIWAQGYFCFSTGEVSDGDIQDYIDSHVVEPEPVVNENIITTE
ncbi:MAG: IS200/IS605 family transposase [Deltaproteobacteria bacterium]|jgi:putative transposase|nr:IS200/IS605 family transposase [Deltaproteobacteria bacterium]MDR1296541.1 IS200/IS605 family transposase [Deltaproteobacteria bacterium]